jgi:hypothetical protein
MGGWVGRVGGRLGEWAGEESRGIREREDKAQPTCSFFLASSSTARSLISPSSDTQEGGVASRSPSTPTPRGMPSHSRKTPGGRGLAAATAALVVASCCGPSPPSAMACPRGETGQGRGGRGGEGRRA